MRIHVSVLPAHPTVSRPSSSLSRLIRIEPVTSAGSSAFAPSSPTSSATVISSSSGPWGSDSSSTSAIIAAIATPSSAPSVVPSAVSHSPSRTSAIRPSAGSFGLDGSRSQTMSRCPCSVTTGAPSRPGVAGTRMTRFRPASCCSSKPCCSAHARTCSITGSSCRDGRGIFVSVSKCPQNERGSSPLSTDVSAAIVVPAPRLGERVGLQDVELLLRDHTAVEQLLAARDLLRRAAARSRPSGARTRRSAARSRCARARGCASSSRRSA